jgi:IclR family pca regulon transcriptional regulator
MVHVTGRTDIVALAEQHNGRQLERFVGDPDFMASLARGLMVIRAFNDARGNLSIAEISHKTGFPRAAVRRCLYTLAQLGYISAAEHRYTLTPRMLTLGQAYLYSTPLVILAQPILDGISVTLHESSSLSILDGTEILYLARSAATRIMSVALHVGSRLPAFCTSMGQILLAHLEHSAQERYLAYAEFTAYTEHSVTSRIKLRKVLHGISETGFAIVDQQLEIGLRSIAVPVRDSTGAVVAAINSSAQSSRVSLAELRARFLPVLLGGAAELGRLL